MGYGLPGMVEFEMVSRMGDTRTWAWQSRLACEKRGLTIAGNKQSKLQSMRVLEVLSSDWTAEMVAQKLAAYKVDQLLFGVGEAITLEDFAEELKRGDAYLMEPSMEDSSG